MRHIVWIRLSMLLTILICLLPFMVEKGWQIKRDVADKKAGIGIGMGQSADFAQEQFKQLRAQVENIVKVLGPASQAMMYMTPTVCNLALDDITRDQSQIGSISILTPLGIPYCGTSIQSTAPSLASAPLLMKSTASHDVVWTDLYIDPVTKNLAMRAAFSYRDGDAVKYIITVEVDGQALLSSITTAFWKQNSATFLVAENGNVLLSKGSGHEAVPPLPPDLIGRILNQSHTTFDDGNFDNAQSLVTVTLLPGTNTRLVNILKISGIYSNSDSKMAIDFAVLFCETAIVFFVLMMILEYTLLGALRSLVVVAEEISDGNLTARAVVKTPFPDFHLLAKAFNTMVDRLEEAALIDALTTLPNRKLLDQHCHTSMSRFRRYGTKFSVAMIDVDQFKRYNDMYGHLSGDEVLKRISSILSNYVRRPDEIAGRYGGEEFLLVLTETDEKKIAAHLDRVRQAVSDLSIPHVTSDHRAVTISIGFTVVRDDDSLESLINRADKALYAVKSAGRNGVKCLDEGKTVEQFRTIGVHADTRFHRTENRAEAHDDVIASPITAAKSPRCG